MRYNPPRSLETTTQLDIQERRGGNTETSANNTQPQHTQGNKQAEVEADKEAEAKIREIKEAGKKSQDQVVKDLLKAVFEVNAEPVTD